MDLEQIRETYDKKFKELSDQVGDLNERREHAVKEQDGEAQKAVEQQITELSEAVKSLTDERDTKLREVESESQKNRLTKLEEALKAVESDDRFKVSNPVDPQGGAAYGPNSDESFYLDAHKALVDKDSEAFGRWKEAIGEKAMTEGLGSTGGLLVPDQISNELLELKVQQTVLRGLFSSLQVSSDTLRIPAQTQGLVAGWVAELAQKPVSDLAFGEISVNVFQKAGMAVVTNQLLQDAKQSIQSLISRDLAKRLGLLEELAFINGSGNGQPLGILNTPGVQTTSLTSTGVKELLDAIITAITNIYTNFLAPPNAIVMHPRTWARIVSAHSSGVTDEYLLGPPSGAGHRQATDRLPGYGDGPLPLGNLFGFPVYTTPSVPTTLSTNQSAVIVGAFDEGLILEHSGIRLDASEHVYFTSNQTIFRAEDRVGFTAARYPAAFDVIGGVGLANG